MYYDKDTNPFVAYVDKVYWGAWPAEDARPAEDLEWWQYGPQWKRDTTLYKVWDGNSWDTEASVNAGPSRACGSSDNGLCWWNLNNDVTLEGSARVDQRLKYHYFYSAGSELNKLEWPGSWHQHYLE